MKPDKIRQLRTCTVAPNPLFSGAGTNLKMLDYMAAGAPIVASPVGARGLDLEHGIDTYIIDTGAFTPTIRSVLAGSARPNSDSRSSRASPPLTRKMPCRSL